MTILLTILLFAGTLLVLVGVHELGHFVSARLAGVRVLEFAFGFGPRLLSRRRGNTLYSVRLVPLGGFVRMAGDVGDQDEEDVPREEMLVHQKPIVRIAIGLAGPLSNVLITLVVTLGVALGYGVPAPQVVALMPDMPAEGVLMPGDALLRVGGTAASTIDGVSATIASSQGEPLTMLLMRDGERMQLELTPVYDPESERYILGFYMDLVNQTRTLAAVDADSPLYAAGLRPGDSIVAVNDRPLESATELVLALMELLPSNELTLRYQRDGAGIETTALDTEGLELLTLLSGVSFEVSELVYHRYGLWTGLRGGWGQFVNYFRMFGAVISGVFRGRIAPGEAFRGPVGIAQMLGESAGRGPLDFLVVFSLLSLSLGLMNLLPFPALDGSRIVFSAYEMIRGKPFPPEREGLIHAIGFVILLGLFVLITYKDLMALFQ
jgi:regulator of sigma E protease